MIGVAFGLQEIASIVDWFKQHGQDYPWSVSPCQKPDPYAVWVSEVMLQQTTTTAVIPRYQRWMDRFPTNRELADSSLEDVLREWEGLGYYSRAKNLHSAAREVQTSYGNQLPKDIKTLKTLPGVGEYIASALASFAFGMPSVALEANGRRIVQRFTGAKEWDGKLEKNFRSVVEKTMLKIDSGIVNAAVMQFGQRLCTSRGPRCTDCPLAEKCFAHGHKMENEIPQRRRQNIIKKTTDLAVLLGKTGVWIRKKQQGIVAGLWVFPEKNDVRNIEAWKSVGKMSPQIHTYTRYRNELRPELFKTFLSEQSTHPTDNGIWVPMDELHRFAMPTAYRHICENLFKRLV